MVDVPATGDVLITTEGRRHLLSVVPYPHRLTLGDYDLALDIARRWAETNAVEVRLRDRRQRHQGAAGLGRCLLHAQGGCSTWEHAVATRAPVSSNANLPAVVLDSGVLRFWVRGGAWITRRGF